MLKFRLKCTTQHDINPSLFVYTLKRRVVSKCSQSVLRCVSTLRDHEPRSRLLCDSLVSGFVVVREIELPHSVEPPFDTAFMLL